MRNIKINLGELTFLIADSNSYSSAIAHSILRGFGANKVVEVRDARVAIQVLTEQRIDLMLCDPALPPVGGIEFIRTMRRNPNNPYRTLPVLILTGDTRISTVKQARDSGANMIVAKPISPAAVYERLAWVAFNPRKFVEADTYFGPDRRLPIEGPPEGRSDNDPAACESAGPTLSQSEIDSLLNFARNDPA
ncbi:MAG: response regulator [Hyphomicrobiales bacterium]|nr:response regulator [Hyphomicrobiales bacterium]